MRGSPAIGWLLIVWLSACDSRADARFCELGVEHVAAQVWTKSFDAIELSAAGTQPIALWSEPGGLFGRRVDREGRPNGNVQRLGPRCAGGLAAMSDGSAIEVACLIPATRGKQEEAGGLQVYRIGGGLAVERIVHIGSAGALSEGVDMARGARGIEIVWQDAAPDAHQVMWASLADAGASARALSASGRDASAPSIAARDGGTAIAWSENWLEAGELRTRVVYLEGQGRPRSVLSSVKLASAPQLFTAGTQLMLGYRDRSAVRAKTGLYVVRLGPGGERIGKAERIGRADGLGKPALHACMGGVVAATPRTYAGEYFVGVNWLDADLHRSRGEQQFYEDSHAFTQVAATCSGDAALLLIAEFPKLESDTTALRAVSYHCGSAQGPLRK
jgi:hypothetical protein